MTAEEVEETDRRAEAERDATTAAQKKEDEAAAKRALSAIPKMFQAARMADVPHVDVGNPTLIFFGNFGTGKTHAAYALAHHLILSGEIRTFRVLRAFKLMMEIKSGFSSGDYDKRFDKIVNTGLLVIDEYGKNSGSDFEESVMYEIISARYEAGRRTVIIVNAKDREEVRKAIRPDVLDRFRSGATEFDGKSRR